jgi:hypothetical protein
LRGADWLVVRRLLATVERSGLTRYREGLEQTLRTAKHLGVEITAAIHVAQAHARPVSEGLAPELSPPELVGLDVLLLGLSWVRAASGDGERRPGRDSLLAGV